jgi:hypothetical protein
VSALVWFGHRLTLGSGKTGDNRLDCVIWVRNHLKGVHG